MAVFDHAACGVRLLPDLENEGLIVVNTISEEKDKVAKKNLICYDSGWAYLEQKDIQGKSEQKWVKEILPAAVCSTSEGRIYVALASGTQWLDNMKGEVQHFFPVTSSISGTSQTLSCHKRRCNIKGMYIWWDMRLFQDTPLALLQVSI